MQNNKFECALGCHDSEGVSHRYAARNKLTGGCFLVERCICGKILRYARFATYKSLHEFIHRVCMYPAYALWIAKALPLVFTGYTSRPGPIPEGEDNLEFERLDE